MHCEFVFICDKTWEELTPTDDPKVKDCDQCSKTVTFCDNYEELMACAMKQQCVCYLNPEANSPAVVWDKVKNKIEFIHDSNLTPADKNKMTSAFFHDYYTAFPPTNKSSDSRPEHQDDMGLIKTMGLVTYPEPDLEELKQLRNDPNNPFHRKQEERSSSWFKRLKRFLFD